MGDVGLALLTCGWDMDRKVALGLGLLAAAFAGLLVAYAQATEIVAATRGESFLSEKAFVHTFDAALLPATAAPTSSGNPARN